MSKSIKFKNDNYWDSTSIVHNRQQLDKILNKSVDEQEIGLLYDGRRLYRRIIHFSLTGKANEQTVQQVNLSSWNIQSIQELKAVGYWDGGSAIQWNYYVSNNDFGRIYFDINTNLLNLVYKYPSAVKRYIQIEIIYTKK